MQYTANYGFHMPDSDDAVNIEDLNSNMRVLDGVLHSQQEYIGNVDDDVRDLESRMTNHSLNDKEAEYVSNFLTSGTQDYTTILNIPANILEAYRFVSIEIQYYNNSVDQRLLTLQRFLELFNGDNNCRFYHVQGTSGYIGLYANKVGDNYEIKSNHENLPNSSLRIEIKLLSRIGAY